MISRKHEHGKKPYYNLWISREDRTLLAQYARDSEHALAIFGRELGVRLTLEDQDGVAPYMHAESEDNVHWVKPDIPVFEIFSPILAAGAAAAQPDR